MKKLVFILFILATVATKAQTPAVIDTTIKISSYVLLDLKTTKDTVLVNLTGKYNKASIVAYTTSGQDTLYVSTKDISGTVYSRKTLKTLSDSVATTINYTKIIVTTTPKEWLINDPKPSSILIMRTHKLVTTKVIIAGKQDSY